MQSNPRISVNLLVISVKRLVNLERLPVMRRQIRAAKFATLQVSTALFAATADALPVLTRALAPTSHDTLPSTYTVLLVITRDVRSTWFPYHYSSCFFLVSRSRKEEEEGGGASPHCIKGRINRLVFADFYRFLPIVRTFLQVYYSLVSSLQVYYVNSNAFSRERLRDRNRCTTPRALRSNRS